MFWDISSPCQDAIVGTSKKLELCDPFFRLKMIWPDCCQSMLSWTMKVLFISLWIPLGQKLAVSLAYQIGLFEQSVWTNIHLVSLDHIIPNECRVIFFLCFPYQHQRTQAGNTPLCTPVCHRSYGNGRDLSARILRGESVSPLGDSTMRRHGYLPSSSTGFTISTTFFHSIMFCIMLSDISSFSTKVLIAWAILVWHVRWAFVIWVVPMAHIGANLHNFDEVHARLGRRLGEPVFHSVRSVASLHAKQACIAAKYILTPACRAPPAWSWPMTCRYVPAKFGLREHHAMNAG